MSIATENSHQGDIKLRAAIYSVVVVIYGVLTVLNAIWLAITLRKLSQNPTLSKLRMASVMLSLNFIVLIFQIPYICFSIPTIEPVNDPKIVLEDTINASIFNGLFSPSLETMYGYILFAWIEAVVHIARPSLIPKLQLYRKIALCWLFFSLFICVYFVVIFLKVTNGSELAFTLGRYLPSSLFVVNVLCLNIGFVVFGYQLHKLINYQLGVEKSVSRFGPFLTKLTKLNIWIIVCLNLLLLYCAFLFSPFSVPFKYPFKVTLLSLFGFCAPMFLISVAILWFFSPYAEFAAHNSQPASFSTDTQRSNPQPSSRADPSLSSSSVDTPQTPRALTMATNNESTPIAGTRIV